MTNAQVQALQRALNRFSRKYLRGVTPLIVDGDKGTATNKRITGCKYFLGYDGAPRKSGKVTRAFLNRLAHPRSSKYSPRSLWMRGSARRVKQRARHASESVKAVTTSGVTTFDGVPVAKWMVPYLVWARRNGWQGKLVSGWRSPAYSDSLCRRMCGQPKCPGLCAGRDSNHAGSSPPRGALDLSDYLRFASVIAKCPLKPRIYNDLPRDRVHFSQNGH